MRILLLAFALLLSACATAPSGLQVETVSTGQPLPGANCVVSNGSQNWNIVTPATVLTFSGGAYLRVWCDKPGYRTSELVLQGGANSAPWWGPSVGLGVSAGSHGHAGVGLGLSFPFMGPAVRSYPGRVTVEMSPQ